MANMLREAQRCKRQIQPLLAMDLIVAKIWGEPLCICSQSPVFYGLEIACTTTQLIKINHAIRIRLTFKAEYKTLMQQL